MSRFRELKEFERNFETMSVAELERWKEYWSRHADQLAPKARKTIWSGFCATRR